MAGLWSSGEKVSGVLGGGEVVAAEVQLVGHVALARIDVLAVEDRAATRAVELLAEARVPLVREIGRRPGMPGIEFMLQTAPLHQGVSSSRAANWPVAS